MDRLYALYLLYDVANSAREYGHVNVHNWALAEIKDHASHLATGDSLPSEAPADE
jgi:hypothetical protein